MAKTQRTATKNDMQLWLENYTSFLCHETGLSIVKAMPVLEKFLAATSGQPFPEIEEEQDVDEDSLMEDDDDREESLVEDHDDREESPMVDDDDGDESLLDDDNDDDESLLDDDDDDDDWESVRNSQTTAPATTQTPSNPHPRQGQLTLPAAAPQVVPHPIGTIADYDPLWVQKGGCHPNDIECFTSKMKFETVFNQNVIRVGDRLVCFVECTRDGMEKIKGKAHLTVSSNQQKKLD